LQNGTAAHIPIIVKESFIHLICKQNGLAITVNPRLSDLIEIEMTSENRK